MNIQVQCCGIVLLLVFFYFFGRQKRLHLNTEKAFSYTLAVGLVSITMDALSIVAICNMDRLPLLLVKVVCKTYLVTLIALAICAVCYICTDVYTKQVQYKRVIYWNGAVGIVSALLIFILPISFYVDTTAREVYTYGPSVLVAYIAAAVYLAVNLVLQVQKRNIITKGRQRAMRFWLLLWVGAALIQFLDNGFLIVGYASALGIMILYILLENPEMNLDRQTGLFNQTALAQYMKQLSGTDRHFSVVLLVLESSFYKTISQETETATELEMVKFILGMPGALAFKSSEDEIFLLYENKADAENGVQVLRKRFESGWGKEKLVFRHPFWIYLPDSALLKDGKDISYLIRHVRQNSKELMENSFLEVDEKLVSEMYRRREMEQTVFNAIEQDRITVYYQPIYSTREKKFTSAEALVRIIDESGKIVPPYEFICVAEKNGMMLRLGEIIFEKVCRFIKENNPEQYGIHYIEVNLSAVQCAQESFADTYIALMEKYGIPPRLINLEITETAALEAKKVVLANMKKLIDYGVSFSLDDFGTGQSNLNYIVDMPVAIVKFDRSMTTSYFENGKAKYVMDAAMHMIHGMRLEIVSEGIETKEQYDSMESLNISYIQGYYFSKPLPEQSFVEFIRERNA